MRTRVSFLLVALAAVTASAAQAGGPGAVYTDFAQDGKLSCGHSRADLEAALRSGTLNQYGDPLTLARMKLAVRKQLAGGCKQRSASTAASGSGTRTTGTATTPTSTGSGGATPEHAKSKPAHRDASAQDRSIQRAGPSSDGNGSFLAGRGLVIGLLAGAVALGGWLTKHALSARP
jgi:hypothetical protein